ncbi:MAG: nuclear transport factor 2 family protein [Actinomycetota bacterium]
MGATSGRAAAPTDPEAVVRSYLASFTTADPAAIAAHVTPNFVNRHTAALGTDSTGRSTYEQRLPGFLTTMAGLRYEIEDLVVDGALVAAFYTMTANWQGRRPISIRGVQRLRTVEGLIAERTDYWDSASFLLQTDQDAAAALARFGISTPGP